MVGLWSHFAYADAPDPPDDRRARSPGVRRGGRRSPAAPASTDARRHLANSAATLTLPDTWYDLVRPGIAVYGLDPLGGDPAATGCARR